MLEPAFAEAARAFRLDDLLAFRVQFDVIAHTAAKGARGVLDDGQTHERFSPAD
jgi:hypothetical protein